ncbi:MAG: right-handed parallel beta-helix repeat-containing protein [Bacteroidales bacterium]|nr:right-handed parallel beta-helix repeat-containing protein [Bacteroidales bacterium]
MKRIAIFLMALFSTIWLSAGPKTYFVSPDGNDNATGLSVKDAWKSLDKISSTEFQPGDQILLESGAVWHGQLNLKGSGTPEQPIILSSFGGKKLPVINIGKAEGAGILLHNQGGWEISNIEITSSAAPELGVTRQGIYVKVDGEGLNLEHIVIKDCFIHDIWGQMGGVRERSSAILVSCSGPRVPRGETSTFVRPTLSNILIEGNRIERVDKTGIVTNGVRNGVKVRRNYMDNLGGDGIIVSGAYRGLIEFNEIHRSCLRSGYLDLPGDENWWPHTAACWIIRCEETIMQFNEVYDTGREPKNGDGFAYDFDFYCKRCIAQYNYSKDNHGFLLLMYDIFENVARYNISQNDKTHLVQMQGSLMEDNNMLYNNVFYVDHGTLDLDFFRGDFPESAKDINKLGAHFYNNIFYATGQGRFRTAYSLGETMVRTFDEVSRPDLPAGSIFLNNCYYGPWKNGLPDDPKAIVADPKFVGAGSGGYGLCSLEGYMLQSDSPCINTGMYMPDNGRRDFFGNAVEDGKTDIGAFEFVGSGSFGDKTKEAQMDQDARDASTVAWSKWSFPLGIVPDDSQTASIRLQEPIETGVSGTITWVNPKNSKTVVLPVEKVAGQGTIAMKLKADRETLLGTSLKVQLKKGRFVEEFEIPFTDKPGKRQGQ